MSWCADMSRELGSPNIQPFVRSGFSLPQCLSPACISAEREGKHLHTNVSLFSPYSVEFGGGGEVLFCFLLS